MLKIAAIACFVAAGFVHNAQADENTVYIHALGECAQNPDVRAKQEQYYKDVQAEQDAQLAKWIANGMSEDAAYDRLRDYGVDDPIVSAQVNGVDKDQQYVADCAQELTRKRMAIVQAAKNMVEPSEQDKEAALDYCIHQDQHNKDLHGKMYMAQLEETYQLNRITAMYRETMDTYSAGKATMKHPDVQRAKIAHDEAANNWQTGVQQCASKRLGGWDNWQGYGK